jgi:hypothetical protein
MFNLRHELKVFGLKVLGPVIYINIVLGVKGVLRPVIYINIVLGVKGVLGPVKHK